MFRYQSYVLKQGNYDRERRMNVYLTPELERLVEEKIKTGMYQTVGEVIREGLRLLNERDQRFAKLRSDLRSGFEATERGEFEEHDARTTKQLAEEIKRRGRQRLAAEKRKTSAL
jgi:antitoxin ParD1/3/4